MLLDHAPVPLHIWIVSAVLLFFHHLLGLVSGFGEEIMMSSYLCRLWALVVLGGNVVLKVDLESRI